MGMFKPTTLYIMQHSVTGKKYFEKTNRKNRRNYIGSGTYWSKHCNKHGKEFVKELWSCLFYDEIECKDFAEAFSELFDIVKSDEWANMIPENGLDGHAEGFTLSEQTKARISKSLTGKPSPKSQYIVKEDLSIKHDRISRYTSNTKWINNGVIAKRVIITDNSLPVGWFLGKLKTTKYDDIRKNKEQEYNKSPKKCMNCGSIIPFEKNVNIFCNRSCRQIYLNMNRKKKNG